jgi:hypothetical protein
MSCGDDGLCAGCRASGSPCMTSSDCCTGACHTNGKCSG